MCDGRVLAKWRALVVRELAPRADHFKWFAVGSDLNLYEAGLIPNSNGLGHARFKHAGG